MTLPNPAQRLAQYQRIGVVGDDWEFNKRKGVRFARDLFSGEFFSMALQLAQATCDQVRLAMPDGSLAAPGTPMKSTWEMLLDIRPLSKCDDLRKRKWGESIWANMARREKLILMPDSHVRNTMRMLEHDDAPVIAPMWGMDHEHSIQYLRSALELVDPPVGSIRRLFTLHVSQPSFSHNTSYTAQQIGRTPEHTLETDDTIGRWLTEWKLLDGRYHLIKSPRRIDARLEIFNRYVMLNLWGQITSYLRAYSEFGLIGPVDMIPLSIIERVPAYNGNDELNVLACSAYISEYLSKNAQTGSDIPFPQAHALWADLVEIAFTMARTTLGLPDRRQQLTTRAREVAQLMVLGGVHVAFMRRTLYHLEGEGFATRPDRAETRRQCLEPMHRAVNQLFTALLTTENPEPFYLRINRTAAGPCQIFTHHFGLGIFSYPSMRPRPAPDPDY